jgi:hypothetical protein
MAKNKWRALVGFDGFIDRILSVVDRRWGPGDHFHAMEMIGHLADRVQEAAGKSTNMELVLREERMGGNGPLLANALLKGHIDVIYIGALGNPIHPLFASLKQNAQVYSIAEPGITHALEFKDGKLLLGEMSSLANVSLDHMKELIHTASLQESIASMDLLAFVNWTMIPGMDTIVEWFLTDLLPHGIEAHRPWIFFDLADPCKRPQEDLHNFLKKLSDWNQRGRVVLGLNLKEAQQVMQLWLGMPCEGDLPELLMSAAEQLRTALDIHTLFIHAVSYAVVASYGDTYRADGFFVTEPKILTGAGDHFNAGFLLALLHGKPPHEALLQGLRHSNHYVRYAETPSFSE